MIPLEKEFDLKTVLTTQKKYNAANIFGFIAFTDSHANVKKVLRDEDYWHAFNEDSPGWLVFSVKPLEKGKKRISGPSNSGLLGMMVDVWDEPNANKEFVHFFELTNTEKLPLFIIFSVIDGSIQKFSSQINDSSIDLAYNSIRGIIKDITASLNGVDPEYRQSETIYGVIERGVKWPRDNKVSLERFMNFVDIAGKIKGLV